MAVLIAVAGLGWGDEQPSTLPSVDTDRSSELESIDPPAPPGSTHPALAFESATTVTQEHEILITWLEPGGSGGRLRFARLSAGTWSRPVTVADDLSTLSTTDRASLTVIDTQAVRRTLIARTGDVVARSGDAGRTWTRLPAPALPFASFAGGDEGGYAFWQGTDGDGAATLLGSRILAGQTLLDPTVFGGSATSAAMTWDGPVVAYRDRSSQGTPDVTVVRREDAQWTAPSLVYADGWRPDEASDSGPQIAALRRQLAIAWYTEAPGPRLLVAFSSDAGRTFGTPVEVDGEGADRRVWGSVDVALDESGQALVLWMTATASGDRELNLARVAPDGTRGEPLVLARGLDATSNGVARITRAGQRVAAAWIDGSPSFVRVVTVPLAGIPAPGSRRPRLASASGRTPRPYRGRGRVGESVPDFELVSLDGDQVSLAALRGRAVLLNLWATWCLPCIAEMPELAALHERHGPEGLVVVGASIDSVDAVDKVRAFVAKHEVPFTIWLDPEMSLSQALRVRGVPATFLIDRDGRILLRTDQAIEVGDPELEKALLEALGTP